MTDFQIVLTGFRIERGRFWRKKRTPIISSIEHCDLIETVDSDGLPVRTNAEPIVWERGTIPPGTYTKVTIIGPDGVETQGLTAGSVIPGGEFLIPAANLVDRAALTTEEQQ